MEEIGKLKIFEELPKLMTELTGKDPARAARLLKLVQSDQNSCFVFDLRGETLSAGLTDLFLRFVAAVQADDLTTADHVLCEMESPRPATVTH